jgi:plastocyanin
MMRLARAPRGPGRWPLALIVATAVGALPARGQSATPDTGAGRLVVVEMVERGQYGMAFDPVRVTARLGDTLRFVQRGRLPHNVAFRSVPEGTELGEASVGPYLERQGATYDVVLDKRFVPGKHVYVCTPHEVLGMAGILYLGPAAH